ncbi:hypothetical protein EC9_48260 [Rosistilla ulvae]|uniref:Uncharacterized protein n=1 Tax=Rosistilla ulvae TaxID=1930277 RepID=A0A517M6V9_9BACT|nr:hypothetical protein EC9_48260 [Rosistilla ulvae]
MDWQQGQYSCPAAPCGQDAVSFPPIATQNAFGPCRPKEVDSVGEPPRMAPKIIDSIAPTRSLGLIPKEAKNGRRWPERSETIGFERNSPIVCLEVESLFRENGDFVAASEK